MSRIYIIEDDRNLSEGLCLALKDTNSDIVRCPTLLDARAALAGAAPDLVILDINLPDGSGLDLLREIKTSSRAPVILLTANDTEMDVVLGLENGADDYITKPFSLAVLRARVNTQLRRQSGSVTAIRIDPFLFDFEKMHFAVGERTVELSKTEQKLLRMLVENRGTTIGRDTLLSRVWPGDADYVDENALSVAIKRLRDKLDASEYIKTVYGIGYSWVVK